MEFIRFVGWILSEIYNLLDFKILDFPLSVIQIMLGVLVFAAIITFLRNVTSIVGGTDTLGKLAGVRRGERKIAERNFKQSLERRGK